MRLLNANFKHLTDTLKASWVRRPDMLQVAALCYRKTGQGHEVLLITSRGRGHWILPKGWPKKKISSAQTALEEAFEEAGIEGNVRERPVGEYYYTKSTKSGILLNCVASVYAIEVSAIQTQFPEQGERKVRWFTPDKAAEAVSAPDLAKLLREFKPT